MMRYALYPIAFCLGFALLSLEIVGSRYLSPFFGSTIFTWASLISTVMLALMIGYFGGGWLADKYPSQRLLGGMITASALLAALIPATAETVLTFFALNIPSLQLGTLFSSLTLFFPPLVLLGAFSPFAIRLLLADARQSGRVSGMIYGISTMGNIVGALVTAFYLMTFMGSMAITYAMAGIILVCGVFLLARKEVPVIVGLAVALGWLLAPTPGQTRDRVVLEHKETLYNDVFVTQKGNYVSMSFRRFGSGYLESTINLTDPLDLPVGYTRQMTVGLLYPEKLDTVVMLGLGGGTTTGYLRHYQPDTAFHVAELDQGVIDLAEKHFGIRGDEKFTVHCQDARIFLFRNKRTFDMIMVDAFRGGYVPFHLLTLEFYQLCAKRLAPGGCLTINAHAGTKLFTSTLRTLARVFPTVHTYGEQGNVIIVATKTDAPDALLRQRATALQRQKGFRYPLPSLYEQRSSLSLDLGEVLTDDFAPANLFESIKTGNTPRW